MRKATILIVDDERAILSALQRALRGREFTVVTAEDGQAALEIFAREPVDLIVSDMRMPKGNGCELLRIVKKQYPATLRVIMSGYFEDEEVVKALHDGTCEAFLQKPWERTSLLNSLRQLVGKSRNALTGCRDT
ncbi:response regulator [Heliobacterium gestii]|uniref:Stage 0 sporulation protein A homolog n=1 Tax=Heliomicrobium gestii TaxID=2699 RepID=A0A845LCC8_HELGE|nr:response regulator [Heliomicrobium gestii]MBM7868286.1 DNA-binding NtrC family response regulator [Heliomicrobium gestii]MZP44477.1 response regulator [Heliomicrobium gestii]